MSRSASPLGVRLYSAALWLYPGQFRATYGDAMTDLLADQLGDEPAWRVYPRAALDLTLTLPHQHLEARMNRLSTAAPTILFAACTLLTAVLIAGVGASTPLTGVDLAVSVLLAALAAVAWRRARPYSEPRPAGTAWWRWLAAGAGAIALFAAVTTATGELPEGGWFIAMAWLLGSIGMLIAGFVLGLVRLATRHGIRPAG